MAKGSVFHAEMRRITQWNRDIVERQQAKKRASELRRKREAAKCERLKAEINQLVTT